MVLTRGGVLDTIIAAAKETQAPAPGAGQGQQQQQAGEQPSALPGQAGALDVSCCCDVWWEWQLASEPARHAMTPTAPA